VIRTSWNNLLSLSVSTQSSSYRAKKRHTEKTRYRRVTRKLNYRHLRRSNNSVLFNHVNVFCGV
jgi:hypothetical protein